LPELSGDEFRALAYCFAAELTEERRKPMTVGQHTSPVLLEEIRRLFNSNSQYFRQASPHREEWEVVEKGCWYFNAQGLY